MNNGRTEETLKGLSEDFNSVVASTPGGNILIKVGCQSATLTRGGALTLIGQLKVAAAAAVVPPKKKVLMYTFVKTGDGFKDNRPGEELVLKPGPYSSGKDHFHIYRNGTLQSHLGAELVYSGDWKIETVIKEVAA